MSETSPEATNTDPKGQEQGGFQPITTQADLDKLIGDRLARERAKYGDYADLKAKAAKLDEMEEASKSELQKLQERLSKAEAAVAAHEQAQQLERWRDEVSQETGIPAKALAGNTLEEIKTHAKTLAELFPARDATPKTIISSEGAQDLPLNGDGIENALRKALGLP